MGIGDKVADQAEERTLVPLDEDAERFQIPVEDALDHG
jgi:hypothetical protein